jgi:hypothetical protein
VLAACSTPDVQQYTGWHLPDGLTAGVMLKQHPDCAVTAAISSHASQQHCQGNDIRSTHMVKALHETFV